MKTRCNRLLQLLICVASLLALAGCGSNDNSESFLSIDDPILQSCYSPRLSKEEWVVLSEFKCIGLGDISNADFSQLRRIPNLTSIKLWVGGTIDANSLKNLSGITNLEMQSRITSSHPSSSRALIIKNLSELNSLPNLDKLKLDTAHFDINEITGLSQISSLDISFTSHTNLNVLSHLTQLKELYINRASSTGFDGGRKISDISPLAALTLLEKLDLGSNLITDISALSGLAQLKELDISGSYPVDYGASSGGVISDISPLATLMQLKKLNLERNNIIDISALATLSQLTELDISDNQIQDISPILGLRQHLAIELYGNCIENFENLPENFEVDGMNHQAQTEGICSE